MRQCIGAAMISRQANDNPHPGPCRTRSSSGPRAQFERLLLLSVSVAALAALSPRSAAAQGWTGATSNDWTVGSNWTGGTAPAGGAVSITTNSNLILGVAAGATGTTRNFKPG